MPFAKPGLTRPLPFPAPPGLPVRLRRTAGGQSLTLAQRLGTWNYTAQVYISFDPPNTPIPALLEVTSFVEADTTINIKRGRADGLSDVTVGTCSLTVDNTDGRWTPTNPTGPWFVLIRKGIWLIVDLLPLSGVVSRRYTGFITDLPTSFKGTYASASISASDRFWSLGNAPNLVPMTSSEVLFDTSTGPVVAAHYPLNEASGSQSFGDISGNAAPPLTPTQWGSNSTALLKASGVPAPGFDAQQAVQFTPTALATGTVLKTTVAPWNSYAIPVGTDSAVAANYGVLELWLQTTFTGVSQAFATLWDPGGANAITFTVDGPTGYLAIGIEATTATSAYSNAFVGAMIPGAPALTGVVLNDGYWHYISIATFNSYSSGASVTFVINIDGKTVWIGASGVSTSLNLNTLIIGGGFAGTSLQNFTGNLAGVSWILTSRRASNYPAHYLAGATGFAGESVDQRVARIARYAGIPEPANLQIPAPGYNPVPVYTPGTIGPWTNLGNAVHQAGTQSIAGRAALEVMREAARTENMPLYVNRSGYLTLRPCTDRYNNTAVWSVDGRDLEDSCAFPDDFQYTINQVTVAPNALATQNVIGPLGAASQNKYGLFSGPQLSTANFTTSDAVNLGLAVVAAGADPPPRFAPLVVEAASLAGQAGYGAAWYDSVLASDISDVVTVTNLPPQAPASSMSMFIEGYSEVIGLGQHTFSFSTSPQTFARSYQCDSPTLGLCDTPGIALPY